MATGLNTANEDLAEQLKAAKETAERCLELVKKQKRWSGSVETGNVESWLDLVKKQKRWSGSVDTAFSSTVKNLVEQLTRLSGVEDTSALSSSAFHVREILLANLYLLRVSLPLQPSPGADANLTDQLQTKIDNLLFRCNARYLAKVRAEQENESMSQELALGTQLMPHQNELTEEILKQFTENLDQAVREKNEIEQEAQAQIRSLREKLEEAEQEIEVKRKADAQTKSLREKLFEAQQEKDKVEREANAQITSLKNDLEMTRQYKDKTEDQAKVQIASLDEKLKKLMDENRHVLKELKQAQQESEGEKQRFSLLLEKEIQLGEEFRRLLGQYESQKDFQTQTREALSRIETRQEEAAASLADIEFRKQQGSLDEDFMNRLPDDVKLLCLRIQRLIGGMGREFGELLLGRRVAWSTEELGGGSLFFTRSKFWLCIRKWVEASVPNSVAPVTLHHLTSVCSQLRVNPTTVEEISEEQESNLEKNFMFLAKHVMVTEVAAFLRNKLKLTEESWTFLLMRGTSRQKVDRLLAVVYSMGQEGYDLLLEALRSSHQQHVVARLTGGEYVDVLGEKTETSTAERGPTHPGGSLLTVVATAAVEADRDNTSDETAIDVNGDNTSEKMAVDVNRDNTSEKTPVEVDRDKTSRTTSVDADIENTSRTTAADADRQHLQEFPRWQNPTSSPQQRRRAACDCHINEEPA